MKKRIITYFVLVLLFQNHIFSQYLDKDSIPRDSSYTTYIAFNKIHKKYPKVKYVENKFDKDKLSEEIIIYKSVFYKNKVVHNLRLINYKEKKVKSEQPVVLLIHGGGWNSGSPEMMKDIAVRLALKGYVTFSAEYRLSPEALYPAGVEDVQDAVKWIYENAEKYGADKSKIAVIGFSAGGQLASLLGAKNDNKLIKAVVNVDGSTNFVVDETVNRAEKARVEGAKIPVDALWLGGTYSENPKNWIDASSVNWVNENSAPTLFINSSIPRFHNGRDAYISQLDNYKINSKVYTFEDSPHSFWLFYPWQNKTISLINSFLKKELK